MANILFYVFLSSSKIERMNDILPSLDDITESERNNRIFSHLALDKSFIQKLCNQCSTQFSIDINNKIKNANLLSNDSNLSPEKRATNALDRFSRISESEVVTPIWMCQDMINCIGIDELAEIVENNGKILDLAAKTGEFAYTIFYALKDRVSVDKLKNCLYAIPTSGATYEFTRRMYEILGLNLENLANVDKIKAYDLIQKDEQGKIDYERVSKILRQNKAFNSITMNDEIAEGDEMVNFDVVVGNPPYQENISKSEGNKSLSKQLFPWFIIGATKVAKKYVSLITPSKWFTSEGQDGSFIVLREFAKNNNHFKQIHHFGNSKNVFSDVEIGAVNYFLYKQGYEGNCTFVNHNGTDTNIIERPLFEDDVDIILSLNQMVNILRKVKSHPSFETLMTITKGRNAFGITGKQEKDVSISHSFEGAYELRCAHEVIKYVKEESITKNKDIADSWKVIISKGNGGAGTLSDGKPVAILGKPFIGNNRSVCTDSLIPIGKFNTEAEAGNLQKYIKTKFLRFMVGILKVSQNVYQNVYKYVPIQDFTNNSDINWDKPIAEIDIQLYAKYGFSQEEKDYIESMIKVME